MDVFKLLGKIIVENADANKKIDETTDKAQSAEGKLSKIFAKIGTAVGAAFTAKKVIEFGTACVNSAMNAETAFAKVNTLLRDDTDTDAYFNSIKQASKETGVAVTDFAEAVYSAISASVEQGSAVEFTTNAIKLAKGGFSDAATAVDVLTTAINAYGYAASDATSIADKLVTTQNLGKIEVGQLAAVMGRSIPTAKAYNVGLDTLCGTYAIMTKNGNPAAESTTLINAMLNELGKSGTTASDVLREKTGKSFSELMASGMSLSDVLAILQDAAQKSGLSINDMFGSAEAGKAAYTLISNAKDLNDSIAQIQGSAGATEAAYSKMSDTMAEKIQKLKNRFDLLKTSIGEGLMPILSFVVDNFDDIAIAAGVLGTAILTNLIVKALTPAAVAFAANAEALAFFTVESGKAAVAEATLTGAFSAGEIIVGVLTGKISLATAAQYAWNTAMSANPIGLVVAGLAALAIGFKHVYEASKQQTAEIAGTANSYEEAAAKAAELRSKIKELENAPGGWTYARTQEIHGMKMALQEVEGQMESFQQAEQSAAESATEPVDAFTAASQEYATQAEALMNKFQQTYDAIYSKVSGWFEPFGQAATTVTTSIQDIMSNMQSQIDFNNTYSANLQYLKEAGLGGLSEAFQAYGADGAAYAAEIVQSLEQVGGATTEHGKAIVDGLSSTYDQMKESQGDLVNTMTDLDGKIQGEMDNITKTYADKLKELDKGAEGRQYAENTMSEFLGGITSGSGNIMTAMSDLGTKMTAALQASIGSITFSVSAKKGATGVSSNIVMGSHADGLNYVPFDGYIAELHKGEMVVPKKQAQALRDGDIGSGTEQIIILLSKILDSMGIDLKKQVANSNVQLDGRTLGRVVRGYV